MSQCIDRKIGMKLHAYEMDQLSNDERDRIEMHLLECSYCFEQASAFDQVVDLLQKDIEIKEIFSDAAVDTENAGSWLKELVNRLWPKTNFILKPAVTYFLLALMIYPAYLGFQQIGKSPAYEVTSIVLTSNRASKTFISADDQNIVVSFRINGAVKGNFYQVNILSEDGTEFYKNNNYTNFDELEMASLLLQSNDFHPGNYSIEIHQPSDSTFTLKYYFTIK